MFDYFIIFLWFVAQLKKASDWITSNREEISGHLEKLGVSGYTGSYVYAITSGFDWKMFALFVSGVAFTIFAKKLK